MMLTPAARSSRPIRDKLRFLAPPNCGHTKARLTVTSSVSRGCELSIRCGAAIRRRCVAGFIALSIAHIELADVAAGPGQRFRVHHAEPERRDRCKPKHARVTVRQARDIVE